MGGHGTGCNAGRRSALAVLALAGTAACALLASPAAAQTATPPPDCTIAANNCIYQFGDTVFTASTSERIVLNPATVTNLTTNSFRTEIQARIAGGSLLYDQSFAFPFSDPLVQAGIGQARLALTDAGGPAIAILGPTLVSHVVTNSTSSATTYSFDHATTDYNAEMFNGSQLRGSDFAIDQHNGNVSYQGQVIGHVDPGGSEGHEIILNSLNGVLTPTYVQGQRSTCAAAIAALPGTTLSACTAGNGQGVYITGGQEAFNLDAATTDYVNQNTTTTTDTLTTEIYTLTGTVQAFGTVHAAVTDAIFDAGDRFRRRLLDTGGAGAPGQGPATPGDPIWVEGYGAWSRTRAQGDFPGDRVHGGGIAGGLDYNFRGGLTLGAAIDHGTARIREPAANESAHLSLTQLGLYGGWHKGGWFLNLNGSYGWARASTIVSPLGFNLTSTARFRPSNAGIAAETGDRIVVGRVTLTPSLGAAWSRVDSGTFTEAGSLLALTGPSARIDRTKGWAGLTAETSLGGPQGALTLKAYGRAMLLGGDDLTRLPVTFVGSATTMTIDGADTGHFGADLGASAGYRVGRNVRLYAGYDARLRDHYLSQTGSAGLEINF